MYVPLQMVFILLRWIVTENEGVRYEGTRRQGRGLGVVLGFR
jgi:hypothetical protein